MVTRVILDNGVVIKTDIELDDIIETINTTEGEGEMFLKLNKYIVPLSRIVYFEGDENEQ